MNIAIIGCGEVGCVYAEAISKVMNVNCNVPMIMPFSSTTAKKLFLF